MRGRFITLEGGEGAGKTTQLRLLAERLRARGLDIVETREPGGAPGAEAIRRLLVEGEPARWTPMTEALLHYAARLDHVERTIAPALAAGAWVLSDRFADSTMAYQGYGHRLGRAAIRSLHRLTLGDFGPDLTLILDIPVEVGLQRAAARPGAEGGAETRYERMDRDFHERLRRGFREIARAEPERCVVIDADAAPETVAQRLLAAVEARLSLP